MLPKLPSLPPPPPLSAEFHSIFEPLQPGAGAKVPAPQPPAAQLPGAQPPSLQPPSLQPPSLQPPAPQSPPPQSHGWSLFRSSDGKTCIDQGNQSVITNPQAGQTIRLDHLKKEAQIFPMTPELTAMPGAPTGGVPSLKPPPAPLSVKDLGKRFIAGHEALGKSYTYPPLKPPGVPSMPQAPSAPQSPVIPKAPSMPQAPGMPKAPAMPQAPDLPKAPSMPAPPGIPQPHTVEVWTSHQLHLPLESRVTTGMGTQTTIGKQITPGEPPASKFQIPPNYKLVPPPRPPTPTI